MAPSPGVSSLPSPSSPSSIPTPASSSQPRPSPPRLVERDFSSTDADASSSNEELVLQRGTAQPWAGGGGVQANGSVAMNAASHGATGGRKRSMSHASGTSNKRRSSFLTSELRRNGSASVGGGGASAAWGEQSTSDSEGLHEEDGVAFGGAGRRLSSDVKAGNSRRRTVGPAQAFSFPSSAASTHSSQGFAPPPETLPFSRPPSAVTAPYAPSRPGSAAIGAGAAGRPGSAAAQRRIVNARQGWENGFEEELEQEQAPSPLPRTREASANSKGKERAVEPPAVAVYEPPTPTNDPLDPMSALQFSPSPFSTTPTVNTPSRSSSVKSASQLASTISRPKGPPPPALRPPDPPSPAARHPPSSRPNSGSLAFPTSYPSTESLASSSSLAGPSSFGSSSSRGSGGRGAVDPQPSLQQLLQTVDLNAALRLVQTLQTQQSQQQKVAATVGSGTTSNTAVPAAGAVVEPVPAASLPASSAPPTLPPSATFIDFADLPPPRPGGLAPIPASPSSPSPLSPLSPISPSGPGASTTLSVSSVPSPSMSSPLSPSFARSESPASRHSPTDERAPSSAASPNGKRDRRVSLMGGLQKRLRAGSGPNKGSSAAPPPSPGVSEAGTPEKAKMKESQREEAERQKERERERERERVPDERATLSEGGRTFEEQISRVHLTLSPATLRRAQNCAKYLSLRYTPLYAALSAPAAALPLPNPLAAARWRVERAEAEVRERRSRVGSGLGGRFRRSPGGALDETPLSEGEGRTSLEGARLGSTRLTEMGSAKAGGAPSPYGPRRNKNPHVWEVYPDDIADYVAAGGKRSADGDDAAGTVREIDPMEQRRAAIEQLWYNPAAVAPAEKAKGKAHENGAESVQAESDLRRVPTKASTISSGTGRSAGVDGDGRSPYLQPNGRSSTISLSAGSAASGALHSPKLRQPSTSTFDSSPASRPTAGLRQLSFEAAPFQRATSFSSEPYHGSPLRRTTSLSHADSPAPRSPRSLSYGPLPSISSAANGTPGHASSPRSRLASGQTSREDLLATNGGSAGGLVGTASRHRHSASAEGFRHGLSRRFDRIRGRTTDGDGSDAGRSAVASDRRPPSDAYEYGSPATNGHASADLASEPEITLLRSPSRRFNPRLPPRQDSGALSDGGRRRRPYLRKNPTSVDLGHGGGGAGGINGFESDGFVRSSGDEGSAGGGAWRRASRGLLANAWQGFKASIDAYPDPHSPRHSALGALQGGVGADALLDEQRRREAEMRRRRILEEEEDESDDEEQERKKKPPREVVDLGDEDFARVNNTVRQTRNDLAHFDALMPRLPIVLTQYLDELTSHETTTRRDAGFTVDFPVPRLPAVMLAEVARVKEQHLDRHGSNSGSESDTESDTSSASSSSSLDTSSEPSDLSDDGESSPVSHRGSMRSRQPRRRNTAQSSLRQHARRVTDPAGRKPQTRLRSQTMAFPPAAMPGGFGSGGATGSGGGGERDRLQMHGRGSGFAPTPRADPLVLLERVIGDLSKASNDLEHTALKVVKDQEDVDAMINAAVGKVDDAQKVIDQNNFQQLRKLEDHYFRLRTSLARPSTSLDFVWTGLSYAATVLFWLIWAVVALFRVVRGVVFFPFVVLRWLLFLR
ncbi:hypothetical protein JCM10213v2_003024 [Rhodosporidiobolus nylandii]